MNVLQLPVQPNLPDQSLQCELDGALFNLRMRWNQRDEHWYLDISDANQTPVAHGLKIVLSIPLLRKCQHPDRPLGDILAFDTSGKNEAVTLEALGSRVLILYMQASQ